MSQLTKVILIVLSIAFAFNVLLQTHPGVLRSATAIEASTAPAPVTQPTQDQLRKLLLERQAVLEAIAKGLKRDLEAGVSSIAEYVDAKSASLTAGLDLCETKADRVEIYAEIVTLHKENETWAKRNYEHGHAGQVDLAKARVARLDSEIDLLRERLK